MSSVNNRTPNQELASPMTNLANCLGTTLSVRRKLTLSESNETPKKCYDNILHGKYKYLFNDLICNKFVLKTKIVFKFSINK